MGKYWSHNSHTEVEGMYKRFLLEDQLHYFLNLLIFYQKTNFQWLSIFACVVFLLHLPVFLVKGKQILVHELLPIPDTQ